MSVAERLLSNLQEQRARLVATFTRMNGENGELQQQLRAAKEDHAREKEELQQQLSAAKEGRATEHAAQRNTERAQRSAARAQRKAQRAERKAQRRAQLCTVSPSRRI